MTEGSRQSPPQVWCSSHDAGDSSEVVWLRFAQTDKLY